MRTPNNDIKSRVYGRITASTPSAIWSVGDFADFGSEPAVHKALQRLLANGDLERVATGLYRRPRANRLTGRPMAVDYRAVIDAIARRDNARILVDGMTAANDLGLSDAVPGRVVVHTDARLRSIKVGNLTIKFKPTATSKLYWADRPAMRLVQALYWLKPQLDNPDQAKQLHRRISMLLRKPKYGRILRSDLKKGFKTLPVWMRDYLKNIVQIGPARASTSRPDKSESKFVA
jgi:hypothetical protein